MIDFTWDFEAEDNIHNEMRNLLIINKIFFFYCPMRYEIFTQNFKKEIQLGILINNLIKNLIIIQCIIRVNLYWFITVFSFT